MQIYFVHLVKGVSIHWTEFISFFGQVFVFILTFLHPFKIIMHYNALIIHWIITLIIFVLV